MLVNFITVIVTWKKGWSVIFLKIGDLGVKHLASSVNNN